MHPLIYSLPLLLLAGAWGGVLAGGSWTIALPVFTFGLVPAAELLLRGSKRNLTPSDEERVRSRRIYDRLLYATVPGQVGLVILLMQRVHVGALTGASLVGAVATVGIACGAFGINVAHELGHHRSRFDQAMAKILLMTSLYGHFFIEHNRGHHARAATAEDPASAPLGMTIYAFWLRSVTGGWRGAWRLEARRLHRAAHPYLTLRNAVLRLTLAQLALLGIAAALFGWAVLAWVAAAVCGFLMLETVNYIEHYGLKREKTASGRYERVQPQHSWNSNHPLGRVLLFELTRHSDHHANAGRKYALLRHFDDSPQLPTGYPGMILLALVPPLWFAVMNPHVDKELTRLAA